MRETDSHVWRTDSTRTNQALRQLAEQGVDPADAVVAVSTLDNPDEWIEDTLRADVARKAELLRS